MSLRTAGKKQSKGNLDNFLQEYRKPLVAVLIFALVLTIILIFLLFPKLSPLGKEEPPTLSKSQLLTICSKHSAAKKFISSNPSYTTEITFLDQEALQNMTQEFPALYSSLPQQDGLYKVTYEGEEEGLTLLLHPKTKEVVKYYRMRTLNFP